MHKHVFLVLLFLLSFRMASAAGLAGDFNQRQWLTEHGYDLGLNYIGEFERNIRGGKNSGSFYQHRADLTGSIDGEKTLGRKGLSLFVDLMWAYGPSGLLPSKYVGDLQVTSNIEAGRMVKLYESWVQQELEWSKLSFRFGLYDLNTEFYITPTSALFYNSSFGLGREFSQTGLNGPSIYVNPALGLRMAVRPFENTYGQVAVVDGVPGDPADPSRTHISINKEDGALVAFEAGFKRDKDQNHLSAKLGAGFFTYTSSFPTLLDPLVRKSSYGFYLLYDASLSEVVSVFARQGWASPEVNRYASNTSLGVNVTGTPYGRADDLIGFALTSVNLTSQGATQMSGPAYPRETTYELTYKAAVYRGVALQPDLQWVVHPGVDVSANNALVFSTRLLMSL